MNRISRTDAELDVLVQALLVEGSGLIEILRGALFEMHERRRQVTGTSAEPEMVQRINYWQEVLEWVRSHAEAELVLMNRTRSG